MRYLYKIYREKRSEEQFADFLVKRRQNESLIETALTIKPINQREVLGLFYIPTESLMNKVVKTYRNDAALKMLFESLPGVAQSFVVREMLAEEIQSSNEIEGVKSTKKDIVESARAVEEMGNNVRFGSTITMYMELLKGKQHTIETTSDFRKIYDDIIKGEINSEDLPDGEIFRGNEVYVLKNSGSGKKIHAGVMPESKIIDLMDKLRVYMDKEDTPLIIRTAIGHFYYGYIHPFYDGNGRTSRFISSLYLKREYNELTALSVSKGCNLLRNKYLKAFENTNSIVSQGEMNYFIEVFTDAIITAQNEMILLMREKLDLLSSCMDDFEELDLAELQKSILGVLAQSYFFESDNFGVTKEELAKVHGKSQATITKNLEILTGLGIVSKTSSRPIRYSLSDAFFD